MTATIYPPTSTRTIEWEVFARGSTDADVIAQARRVAKDPDAQIEILRWSTGILQGASVKVTRQVQSFQMKAIWHATGAGPDLYAGDVRLVGWRREDGVTFTDPDGRPWRWEVQDSRNDRDDEGWSITVTFGTLTRTGA